jgi:hypothetical protein
MPQTKKRRVKKSTTFKKKAPKKSSVKVSKTSHSTPKTTKFDTSMLSYTKPSSKRSSTKPLSKIDTSMRLSMKPLSKIEEYPPLEPVTRYADLAKTIGTYECLRATESFMSRYPKYKNDKDDIPLSLMSYINDVAKLEITRPSIVALSGTTELESDTRPAVAKIVLLWGRKYGVFYQESLINKLRGLFTPESGLTKIIELSLEIEKKQLGMGSDPRIYEFRKDSGVTNHRDELQDEEVTFVNKIREKLYHTRIEKLANKDLMALKTTQKMDKPMKLHKMNEFRRKHIANNPFKKAKHMFKRRCGICWICKLPIYIFYILHENGKTEQLNTCGQDEHSNPPGVGNMQGTLENNMENTRSLLIYSFIASLGLLPSHSWCNQIKLATILASLPNLSPNAPDSEKRYRPNNAGFQQLHDSAAEAIKKDTVYSYEYQFRKDNTSFVDEYFHATNDTPARQLINIMCDRANYVLPIDGSMPRAYVTASAGMVRLMYYGCRTLSALYEGLNRKVYEKFRDALYTGGNRQRGGGNDVRDFSMLVDDNDMDQVIKGMRRSLEERDRDLDMRYVSVHSYERYYRILLKKLNKALYDINKYGTRIAELYDAIVEDIELEDISSNLEDCEPVHSNQIIILPPSKRAYNEILRSIIPTANNPVVYPTALSNHPLSIDVSKSPLVDLNSLNNKPSKKSATSPLKPAPRRSARIRKIYNTTGRPSYRVGGRFTTRKNKRR